MKRHILCDQAGDAPFYRRRTDKLTREPVDNPLGIVASLVVLTFAVFGALALFSGWVPHR